MASPLLLSIGFLAGLLTIISPCILPVLPAVIASGVTTGGRRRALLRQPKRLTPARVDWS